MPLTLNIHLVYVLVCIHILYSSVGEIHECPSLGVSGAIIYDEPFDSVRECRAGHLGVLLGWFLLGPAWGCTCGACGSPTLQRHQQQLGLRSHEINLLIDKE